MIDIATGAAAGVAAHHASQASDGLFSGGRPSERDFLQLIAQDIHDLLRTLDPQADRDQNEAVPLFPYPSEYVVDDHKKPHLSIFFGASTPLNAYVPGIGQYQKTVGPGWVQCDLPAGTRLSTSDAQTHNIIVSYRDNPIGSTSL